MKRVKLFFDPIFRFLDDKGYMALRLGSWLFAPLTALFALIGHPPLVRSLLLEYIVVYGGLTVLFTLCYVFLEKAFPRPISSFEIIATVFALWFAMWCLGGQGDSVYRTILNGNTDNMRLSLTVMVAFVLVQPTLQFWPKLFQPSSGSSSKKLLVE